MRKKGMKIPQVLKEEEAMLVEALNLRNEKERKKLIKNIGEW
jgi:hypothetical protein